MKIYFNNKTIPYIFFLAIFASFKSFPESMLLNDVSLVEINSFYSLVLNDYGQDCNDLNIFGYMEGHNHGLPTNPSISDFNPDQCIVEGLFFNMIGNWKLVIKNNDKDVFIFDFTIY